VIDGSSGAAAPAAFLLDFRGPPLPALLERGFEVGEEEKRLLSEEFFFLGLTRLPRLLLGLFRLSLGDCRTTICCVSGGGDC
jgi:hypothetical protein